MEGSASSSQTMTGSSSEEPEKRVMSSPEQQTNNTVIPCTLCGRKFLPDRLEKHSEICKKGAIKKRKPFNSKEQRKLDDESADIASTNDAVSGQRASAMSMSVSSRSMTPSRRAPVTVKATNPVKKTNWREQHEEFIKTVRAARGISVDGDDTMSNGVQDGSKKVPAGYIQCPTCERNFNRKAADRHIEFCASQAKKNRLRSPSGPRRAISNGQIKPSLKAQSTPNGNSYKSTQGSKTPTRTPTTPIAPRRSLDRSPVNRRVSTHRSVSPSRRHSNDPSPVANTTPSRVKAMMESSKLKRNHPKTPVVKFKDKFPHGGHSVTSQYMQETESLKELFKRPDTNFSNMPRTVPGVRTGGMSPTGGIDVVDAAPPSGSPSTFPSSISLMKRSLEDLYITQTARAGNVKKSLTSGNISRHTNGSNPPSKGGVIDGPSTNKSSSPLNGRRGSTSGSSSTKDSDTDPDTVINQGSMPRWCHQCGTKYPMTSAKYCYECGARRLGTLTSVVM